METQSSSEGELAPELVAGQQHAREREASVTGPELRC
jgi:hypothetical protein